MRRIIVTSICTLVLSLFGALGANREASGLGNTSNTDFNTTTVEQNITDAQASRSDITSIPESNAVITQAPITTPKANAAENTAASAQADTPKNVDSNILKDMTTDTDTALKAAAVKAGTTANTAVTAQKDTAAASQTNAAQTNNTAAKLVSNVQNCNSNSGKVIVYKNINLSGCKSETDVINKLSQYGYKINGSDLSSILSQLKNGQSSCTGTNSNTSAKNPTAAPTKAPAATPTKTPAAPTKVPTATPTKAPTPTPTKSPSQSSGNTSLSNYASQVLQLVNQERAKAGLSAYTTNSSLTSAANLRAKEIAQSFSHTRPNGTSFSTALQQYNISYRTAGENIAYGQKTPQEVVTGWMNSTGHRANILNSNFNKIGIGVYQSNGTYYWTQEFTN